MKFGCCEYCVNFEDETACDDCHGADAFEFDESLVGISPTGYPYIQLRAVAA